MVEPAELRSRLQCVLEDRRMVPLIALRMPEFAELAWRCGKRAANQLERTTAAAFRRAAARMVRRGDATAHEPGSDWFAIAMLAPMRDGSALMSIDVRAALERVAASMTLETGRRIETGWCTIAAQADLHDLHATVARALERGARDRERYEFVATIGHELRTPLTSIRGYVETLLDDDLDRDTQRRFLQTVRSETLRLGNLVEGMLDFSPLEAPMVQICDATERARAVAGVLAPLAAARSVRIEVAAAGAYPVCINGDACTHVFMNVLENAIKHGRTGGRVALSLRRAGDQVHIRCEDDGPGVPPEIRTRAFDRGVRGSIATPGHGIGLALVKELVESAGGDVTVVRSRFGGAGFAIRLPASHARAESVVVPA